MLWVARTLADSCHTLLEGFASREGRSKAWAGGQTWHVHHAAPERQGRHQRHLGRDPVARRQSHQGWFGEDQLRCTRRDPFSGMSSRSISTRLLFCGRPGRPPWRPAWTRSSSPAIRCGSSVFTTPDLDHLVKVGYAYTATATGSLPDQRRSSTAFPQQHREGGLEWRRAELQASGSR